MDEKDLKALIKEAKSCAKKKDWAGTLKAAKEVLRYENNNYMALVYQGVSLQESGKTAQSLESYKKATKVKPNDLLCWQGIASHYEKSGDKTNPDLLLAYDNIATISKTENNPSKYIDTILKQAGVLRSQNEYGKCLNRLQSCIKSCGHFDKVDQLVVEVAGEMKTELSAQEKELYVSCAKYLHETGSMTMTDEGYRKLFQIYYQSGQFQDLKNICLSLSSKFNRFYHPIDYLCRLYVEKHIEIELSEVPSLVDKLFKLHPSSRFGYFAKGRFLYESKKYVEAIGWLKEGVESKFHEEAAFLLIDAQLKIWDFVSAEDYCKTCKKTKAVKDLGKLNEYHCQALVGQRKWSEVKNILPVITDTKFANVVWCKMLADEENWVEFDSTLEKLYGEYSWEVQYLKAMRSPTDMNDVCKVNNDNVECVVKCGVYFMKLENYESAALAFNQALVLSPSHPIALFNYGKLLKLDDNLEGAKNCFVKAYNGLPSSEIGSCLSDLYFEVNDADSNKKLLLSATTDNKKSRSKWASVRLGVLHLRLGEATEAVIALQKALRTDFNDCDIWETLADAYYARGSYEAASKAYSKCIELGADPIYPRLKIGVINGQLGLEELAIEALSELGDYVPALVELSKIWLQIAEKSLKEGLDAATTEAISEGLLVASRALKNDIKQEILPLKVISNLMLSACSLNVNSEFKVPSCLVSPEQSIDLIEIVNLKSLILIGIRVVMTALTKSKSNTLSSVLYSDLAKFYYYLATKCEVNCGDKAIYHGKKAVSLTPDDAYAWNTLAIVAFDDKKLAQHCYIKSLTLNSVGNPIAWSNLGFLYLSAGHVYIAHQCFTHAQSIEPGYGRTWIGMGIEAEELDSTQAMDLFRHAATVPGTHEFAGFAYSEWLSHCLETEHELKPHYFKSSHLETLSFAPDNTIIFNARSPTAESLNAEGIVSAHARLSSCAVESFTKAVELITNSNDLQVVRENLLVALVQNNQYKKVLEIVQNLKDTEQTFKCLAAAALSSFKLHSFEASFAYYERALKFCTNPVEESDVLVGQGIVAYKLGEVESAKTLLFRGCQSKTNMPSTEGYLALCALGLLIGELDLAAGALQEMKKFTGDRNIHDIALMEAYCLISQAEEPKPLRSILSKLHCYPDNGKLKKVLASHLINFHADGLTARKKLLSSSVLGEKNELAAVAMTYLMEGDFNNAVKYAKSSLRINLGDPASYSVLLASLVTRGIANNSPADLELSSIVKRTALSSERCKDFPRLEEWFKTCEIISN